jgi:hypothetical protein
MIIKGLKKTFKECEFLILTKISTPAFFIERAGLGFLKINKVLWTTKKFNGFCESRWLENLLGIAFLLCRENRFGQAGSASSLERTMIWR